MAKHATTPRARPRWRRRLVRLGIPVALVAVLGAAWAVDAYALGGDVVRNVRVAGVDVGGDERDELTAELVAYAAALASTPVRIQAGEATYETTAGAMGLGVDQEATARRALRAGHTGFAGFRPFTWGLSFLGGYDVEPALTVDRPTLDATVIALEGDVRVTPIEPAFRIDDEGRVAVEPGVNGLGLPLARVAEVLVRSALHGDNPLVVTVAPGEVAPDVPDAELQTLADEANTITDAPLVVRVEQNSAEVDPTTVRRWLRSVPADGGGLQLALDQDAAVATLTELFVDAGTEPEDAAFDLQDGVPVVLPGRDGTACCGPDTNTRILSALRDGAGLVDLDLITTEPDLTTDEANGYGITQLIGGTRAWPESRTGEVEPGFTTFHAAGEARVTNIHRIADLVRGAVIAPDGTFSVNDYVGRRTTANGFVSAGAIRNGQHVSEVGGGVSQFATTLFNTAYFAGLDVDDYQAHTEYFSRYPRGREATMGFPAPDLVIHNTTPHGVLIWTSYTGSSLTITMYSTPFASGEQTAIREGRSGNCAVVTTTRTRTYVDGRTPVEDTFTATYRPGPGRFC